MICTEGSYDPAKIWRECSKLEAIEAIKIVREFVPAAELRAISSGCRGEEKQFFFDKLVELAQRIKTMPRTYEQDGKGAQAIAYLHYFRGNQDWYITELDRGAEIDDHEQTQAFGQADLGYGAEMGYISIPELIAAGVELDLYFEPETLREVNAA